MALPLLLLLFVFLAVIGLISCGGDRNTTRPASDPATSAGTAAAQQNHQPTNYEPLPAARATAAPKAAPPAMPRPASAPAPRPSPAAVPRPAPNVPGSKDSRTSLGSKKPTGLKQPLGSKTPISPAVRPAPPVLPRPPVRPQPPKPIQKPKPPPPKPVAAPPAEVEGDYEPVNYNPNNVPDAPRH